jgi:hypothetical protein
MTIGRKLFLCTGPAAYSDPRFRLLVFFRFVRPNILDYIQLMAKLVDHMPDVKPLDSTCDV